MGWYPVRVTSAALRLNYTQATDLHDGTRLAVRTWTQWLGNQSFTVAHSGSLVIATLNQGALIYPGDEAHASVSLRFSLDNGAQTKKLGSVNTKTPTGTQNGTWYCDAPSGTVVFSGLSVGSHNLKVEYYSIYPLGTTGGGHDTLCYLRPTYTDANPVDWSNFEWLTLQVWELA